MKFIAACQEVVADHTREFKNKEYLLHWHDGLQIFKLKCKSNEENYVVNVDTEWNEKL